MREKNLIIRNGEIVNPPRGFVVLNLDLLTRPSTTRQQVEELLTDARCGEEFEVAEECLDWLIDHGYEEKVAPLKVRAPGYPDEWEDGR